MRATSLLDKGEAVEEWIDRRFFRPIGFRIARWLRPTPITADQVTIVCLGLGLAAGRLCFYPGIRRNLAGVILFVVSDIFDSADGQLARLRGRSTRLGRALDGIADTIRFLNLYVQLAARAIVAGAAWWLVVPLGIAAAISHSMQSSAADFIRQAYLFLAEGRGELDLPGDIEDRADAGLGARLQLAVYRYYVARQARQFPVTVALVREVRRTGKRAELAAVWAREQAPVVRRCAWIGQNIRFALLLVLLVPAGPLLFLGVTVVPMSLAAVLLASKHERNAARQVAIESAHWATAA